MSSRPIPSSSLQLGQKPSSSSPSSSSGKKKRREERKPGTVIKKAGYSLGPPEPAAPCFTIDFVMGEPSLLFLMLGHLSRHDLCRLQRVSKSWHRLLDRGPLVEDLWHDLALREYTRPLDVEDLKIRWKLQGTWKKAVRSRVERDQQRLLRILTAQQPC
ncbi:MAG: F-box protein [archaeon]|nr:F-box protein [archaeon]